MKSPINWLSIILGAIVYMAIGMAWYGGLFAGRWMELTGVTEEMAQAAGFMPFVFSFCAAIIYGLLLNWILPRVGARTWIDGFKYGAIIGLGFIFTSGMITYMYAQKTTEHTFIDFMYPVVCLAVQGAIVMAMRKEVAPSPLARMQN